MVFLGEREVGFHPDAIGFPSIDGCHGVVLLTETGLWGFHNLGGSAATSFAERSKSFAAFVSQHFLTRGVFKQLYGTCFRNKRCYAEADKLAGWKAEMTAYATALGYHGTVSGYDLDKMGYGKKSAYVEYRKNGNSCTIQVKAWPEMKSEKGVHTNRVNHKFALSGSVKPVATQVFTKIETTDGSALHGIQANELDTFTV